MTSDTSIDALATATLQAIDGMIFGRKAHARLADFWPSAGETKNASPDLIEQARLMNALPKYVLTHNGEQTGWANSHTITADDVPRLKAEAKRPIALFAGAEAAQTLLGHGFVDEIRLIQYPVLLGGGTPLFAADGTRRRMTLLSNEQWDSGATIRRYRL